MRGCWRVNKKEEMTTEENRAVGSERFSMTIMQTNNNLNYLDGILPLQIVSIVNSFLKSQAVCWISEFFLLGCIFLCKWMPLNKCSCGDDTSSFPHYHKFFPQANYRKKNTKKPFILFNVLFVSKMQQISKTVFLSVLVCTSPL